MALGKHCRSTNVQKDETWLSCEGGMNVPAICLECEFSGKMLASDVARGGRGRSDSVRHCGLLENLCLLFAQRYLCLQLAWLT
jgi:hypothetical protein